MAIRKVPGSTATYHLVSYDKRGVERDEGTGSLASDGVIDALRDQPQITEVVILSHGWQGGPEDAVSQYDSWLRAMLTVTSDEAFDSVLVVGLHWPSKAWADESLSDLSSNGELATDAAGGATVESLVDFYSGTISDTEAARSALRTIMASAVGDAPDSLSPEVNEAFLTLKAEAEPDPIDEPEALSDETLGSSDWTPQDAFDGIATADDVSDGLLGGSTGKGRLMGMLRQFSFWTMKKRARTVGEAGVADLLREIQHTAPHADVHLIGHSFGCIVISAALLGGRLTAPARPVRSLFLMQGALSLWAYSDRIPALGVPGYFNSIIRDELASGPIVTTQSVFDYAVGRYYPFATSLGGTELLGEELPRYGAVGAFGIQGLMADTASVTMLPVGGVYDFQDGEIYNVDGSEYIATIDGLAGAHNDIAHPEVATAALAAMGRQRP